MSKKTIFLFLSFISWSFIWAQEKMVSGTVTEADSDMPLPGVSVQVKGTNEGVVTDFDGNYSISTNPAATLVFSFLGYTSQEIEINNRTTINVTLEVNTASLDEVVVVGFGEQKRENITGATSFVKMDEIVNDRPIVDATQALQGIAPGLQVVQNSGEPGDESTNINIRGFTSINGGSPLILINNVPGDINDVNPRDIESVSVLKDAAAASIYGARAAFGVVLITTKGAKRNQKVKLDYSTTTSISRPNDLPQKATTRQFVKALNDFGEQSYFMGQNVDRWLELLDVYENGDRSSLNLITDPISGETLPILFDEGNSNAWYQLADTDVVGDFIDHFGYSTIHNFTISGGGENLSFRVNTGYAYEDGVMVTNKDNYKKYNVNAYLDASITPKLKSTSNILFRSSIKSIPSAGYNQAQQLRMFTPTGWFDNGDGLYLPFDTPGNRVRYETPNKRDDDNLRLFEKLEWEPVKNLTLTGEYTFEKNYVYQVGIGNAQRYTNLVTYSPNQTEDDALRTSSIYRYYTNRLYNGLNLYGKYNLDIGQSNFKFLLGYNKEKETYEYFYGSRNSLIDPNTPTFNLATGENFKIRDAYHDWAVTGVFGRFNYSLLDRYFLEANIRYDGSSRFSKGSRFVWLPSFSAGWDISEEIFLKDVTFLSLLKPRASWGRIGNQQISDYYPSIPGYESYNVDWVNYDSGIKYVSFYAPNLISDSFTWEMVETTNFGIDAAFFKNRLNTSVDVYTRKTLGMLKAALPLPGVLGTDAPQENSADLETKGWEVQVGWKDKIGDFTYGLNVNVWDNHSVITKFDAAEKLIGSYYEGRNLGEIWGYVTDGYYSVDDFVPGTLNADLSGDNRQLKEGVVQIENAPTPYPGDIKYKDLNGDGIINYGNNTVDNPGDQKIIGNTTRRYQFGVNGNLGYKGFDLSFILSGVGKRDFWRGTSGDADIIWPYLSVFDNIYSNGLDYWTPDNQDAYYPRIYGNAQNGNLDSNYGQSRRVQTKYLSDESYLRIQNVTLGYSIDSSFLDSVGVDRFRVFIAGNNIWTFDNLPRGLDPDQGANPSGRYPIMAQYSAGFNITF